MRRATFVFNGREYTYTNSTYNHSDKNSRSVEIPIAIHFMSKFNGEKCIEVGNVISHYTRNAWIAIDMREGPIKKNAMLWNPESRLDAILAISTLEHIGYGRYSRTSTNDPRLIIEHLRGWLKNGGKILATIPLGYNPLWDTAIKDNAIGAQRYFMLTRNDENEWEQCGIDDAFKAIARRLKWGASMAILRVDKEGG